MMRILLTHGYFLEEDAKEQAIMKPYVPLGILSISAWLEKQGYDNEVFDSTFQNFDLLKNRLEEFCPDVVGIYVNLMTKINVLRVMRVIREHPKLKHTKIILGGPEVRNHADNFLKHGADAIVIGEGEETMLEVIQYFEQPDSKNLALIRGLIWRNEAGEKIENEERALIKQIDELPFANRKKIDLQRYFDAWKSRHGHSSASVSTMRGCPYTCKWCSRAVYGLSYRRMSAKRVCDELAYLQKNYQFDMIWFVDDVFTISHKWLREFADEIRARELNVAYEIITRADRMSEEVIDMLVESGCKRVWIGAESGSQRIIDAMDRRVDVNQVREMIRLARKKGLEAGTFIMLGYPGETRDDIKETIRHLTESDPDYFTLTVAYPIKGTPLYAEVENRFLTDLEWDSSTDRDIDFKRTYSRKFYDYAVRWVYNEVALHKAQKNASFFHLSKLRLKSIAARSAMWWFA